MDLARAPTRAAVAGELAQTMALAVGGSAALFALLGGLQSVRRSATAAVALGAGAVVMLAGLLLLTLCGLWRTAQVRQVLGADSLDPGSLTRGMSLDGSAARFGRAVRTTQRLPYFLGGGFLSVGAGAGVVVAVQLAGLRPEERIMAALLWGFGCGIAALGVLLRLRSFIAPLAQTLQARVPDSVRPLLSVRGKLLGGFGWLLLCVTSLSLLKQLLLGQVPSPALRGLLFVLPVQVAGAGGIVALAVAGLAWPVRDLLRRAAAVVGEARGALQRPIVLGVSATAEVLEQQRLFEQLRRLLLARLRSSTEQNLQLEAEVARRTGELSRRNEELSDALFRLQSAREELLRAEKLATVGRIAAGITGEIDAPVTRMSDFTGQLIAAVHELLAAQPLPPAPTSAPGPERALDRALASLTTVTDGASRVRDIVRAMRVYVRPGETQVGRCDIKDVLADVRQLFGEPLRQCIQISDDEPTAATASLVLTVRSELALLLASWLVRVEPRLRDHPDPRVVVRTRLVAASDRPGAAQLCELTLWDNGQPLSPSELIEPVGPELRRRLGAEVEVRSVTRGSVSETVLLVRLPTSPGPYNPAI